MAEAEIIAAHKEMKAAWAAGDLNKIMSMYTEDCSFASNEGTIQKGKAQVKPIVAEFLAKYATCDMEPVDRVICGNCCNEMGTFSCTQKVTGTVDKGKYLAAFVKKDGKWLARFDCSVFN